MPQSDSEREGFRARAVERFRQVRADTLRLITDLTPEDMTIQSMPDASPVKWHLAHSTWFFETFVLKPNLTGYASKDESFAVLFNSYYQTVGPQWARPLRGQLSRPSVAEVLAYRAHVEAAMDRLFGQAPDDAWPTLSPLIELGLHHEQQHQELLCTDIKHAFSSNPLFPAAMAGRIPPIKAEAAPIAWAPGPEGLVTIGSDAAGFAFDNERPQHQTFLRPYALADRLVTNGEFLAFIEDGGYRTPALWLAEGWDRVNAEAWDRPLNWVRDDDGWHEFTLHGLIALDLARPVVHLSAFEAAAFAAWAGARLPTEAEWEAAARGHFSGEGAWLFTGPIHPRAAPTGAGLKQMAGDVWEWTQSAYSPYPGFRPEAGALGEYNGKFMINQLVLRGGSCATPAGHCRPTYRNFFPAHARWQFSGVRLAKDL